MPVVAEQLGMMKVLHHGGTACWDRYQIVIFHIVGLQDPEPGA